MAVKKKSQSEKFIEKAKELGADESGETFERAMKKIIRPASTPKRPQKAQKERQ